MNTKTTSRHLTTTPNAVPTPPVRQTVGPARRAAAAGWRLPPVSPRRACQNNARRRLWRALGVGGLAALTLALTGCVVTSVYPFYEAKDVAFDLALLGAWAQQAGDAANDVWRFERDGEQRYRLVVQEGDQRTEFRAVLFHLQRQRFLDLVPSGEPDQTIPPHYLLRVGQIGPTLRTATLSHDWLKKLLAQQPKAIAHLRVYENNASDDENYRLVLTAPTPALKKFLVRHLETQEAWDAPDERRRLETPLASTPANSEAR